MVTVIKVTHYGKPSLNPSGITVLDFTLLKGIVSIVLKVREGD